MGSVIVAALSAVVVVALLASGSFGIFAVGGVVGIVVLAWAVRRTILDPVWLFFALVLEETCPYLNFLPFDYGSRWWIRYPILLSLCLPALPAAWRSGILRRGYFMVYMAYLVWAALSITYSKYPAVSVGRLLPAAILFAALSLIAVKIQSISDIYRVLDAFLLACALLVGLNIIAALAFPANVAVEGDNEDTVGIYTWILDLAGIMRFGGFFGEPNAIGELMLATLCAGFVRWPSVSGWYRRLLVCIMAAALILGLMADSRSCFLGLGAGIAGFTIWKWRFRGVVACLCVIGALSAIYWAIGQGGQVYVNRDLDTLTGRTMVWRFEMQKVTESPLIGYGYQAEGSIFEDRHFPDWGEFFTGGPSVELHNGYMSVAVGMGVPALIFWLFIFLAPWISLFRQPDDDWHLKPIFFLIIVPGLVRAFGETGISEPRYPDGLLLFMCWMLAERYRLSRYAAEYSQQFMLRAVRVNFQRLLATEDR